MGMCRFAHQVEHVLAEAVTVGGGVGRLIDAVVDGTTQMFDKRAIQTGIDRADRPVGR